MKVFSVTDQMHISHQEPDTSLDTSDIGFPVPQTVSASESTSPIVLIPQPQQALTQQQTRLIQDDVAEIP